MKKKMKKAYIFLLILMAVASVAAQHNLCSHATIQHKGIPALPPNELQSKYDIKYYCFNLSVQNTTTAIEGDVTMKVQVTAALLDTFSFYLHTAYSIDSIIVNNLPHDITSLGSERLICDLAFANGEMVDVQIYYHGTLPDAVADDWTNGIYSNQAYGCHITYTISCPFSAYGWFPAKQELNDKIDSADFHYTTTLPNKVAANGSLTSVDTLSGGRVCYNWTTKYPIDYYLIAFGCSDYREYNFDVTLSNGETLFVQNFLYNHDDYFNNGVEGLGVCGDMLSFYSNTFCLYPFISEKFGHLSAPINGGMEHQTMVTMKNYGEDLIAHEMAHQWFGDMITCGTWSDVWLNEGFARYCEQYIMRQHRHDYTDAQQHLSNLRSNLTKFNSGSVYVPEGTTDFYRIFNSTLTYDKGALVLHNLRFVVNDDSVFFEGIRSYLSLFAYKTATTEDFKNVMEQVSGLDLSDFFSQWIYGEGYPVFDIKWQQDGNMLLMFSQQTTTASGTPLFKTPFEIVITYDDYSTQRLRLNQSTNQQLSYAVLDKANTIIDIVFDPDMKLLAKGNFTQLVNVDALSADSVNVSVYPNPAKSEVNFSCSQKMKRIEIYNLSGQQVYEQNVNNKLAKMQITNFKQGNYIAKIQTDTGLYIKKIIIE
jgi:aminopeptidase N